MNEPIWIDPATALAVHDEQLAEHGGQSGVRELALLESALAKPRQRFAYGKGTLTNLAASLAFGLSRNHPFIDGNKRVSLVLSELFLELNGLELTASNEACVTSFLRLAAGEWSEADMAAWLHRNTRSS